MKAFKNWNSKNYIFEASPEGEINARERGRKEGWKAALETVLAEIDGHRHYEYSIFDLQKFIQEGLKED